MKDKAFITLAVMFFLIFFMGVGIVAFNEPLSNMIRAKDEKPSADKSFGVVFPQVAKTGDKVKVSIYIRDVSGNVLANRSIKLAAVQGTVQVAPSDTLATNDIGQAEFSITTSNPGTVKLAASDLSSNTQVNNIPTIEFSQ